MKRNEPKFKVGDYVLDWDNDIFIILDINNQSYNVKYLNNISYIEKYLIASIDSDEMSMKIRCLTPLEKAML